MELHCDMVGRGEATCSGLHLLKHLHELLMRLLLQVPRTCENFVILCKRGYYNGTGVCEGWGGACMRGRGGEEAFPTALYMWWRVEVYIHVMLSQAVVLDCIACLKTGSLQLWPFSPALLPFMSCVSLLPPSPIPPLSPLLCPSPPFFSALPKVFHRSIRNFMVCMFVAVQETHIAL